MKIRLANIILVAAFCVGNAWAQTAIISDAWWTYEQDCNGDGCKAGTLPGNYARLNWGPDVLYCNGPLNVFEIVSTKSCAEDTWTPLYTNVVHTITACRSINEQYVDVAISSNCACRDYQIAIYRDGQTVPDMIYSQTNDPDLVQKEQPLADDFCLSDFFASCVSLAGGFGSQSDDNTYATKEPGEPDHAGNAGGKSLWYCWVATNTEPIAIDTIGSSFDTLLAVYTGDVVSNLTLVAANDDIAGATNRASRVTFTPVAGTTYHIAVDGFSGAAGNVVLNWNQTGTALPDLVFWGPAVSPMVITRTFTNGDCEVVEGCETPGTHQLLSFSTETRNIGAGDLDLGSPYTNSLFLWASCHGHFHFEHFAQYDLLDTNGNVVVAGHKVGFCLLDDHAWSPTAPAQYKYDCYNQGIQAGWADVYAAGLPCQYIDVTGVPAGNYVLQMTVNPDGLLPESNYANNTIYVPVIIPPTNCTSVPANDMFAAAVNLSAQTPLSVFGFNSCATTEPGEAAAVGITNGKSLWYNWMPASNQTAVITTKASDFDTILGVYTGTEISTLVRVATNDDIAPGYRLQSAVSFAATAGVNYHIGVFGNNGAVGTAVLNINPAANDDFLDAIDLSGPTGQVSGSTVGTSKEPGEPAHAGDVGGHSVWYSWITPTNGPVDFNTVGSSFNTLLAVYTVTNGPIAVTNLNVIVSNDDDPEAVGLYTSRVWFNAVAGGTYYIAVDGAESQVGSLVLNWNMECNLSVTEASGEVQISLKGVNSHRYEIEYSSDFQTWTPLITITMANAAVQCVDHPASSQEFYRAIRVP